MSTCSSHIPYLSSSCWLTSVGQRLERHEYPCHSHRLFCIFRTKLRSHGSSDPPLAVMRAEGVAKFDRIPVHVQGGTFSRVRSKETISLTRLSVTSATTPSHPTTGSGVRTGGGVGLADSRPQDPRRAFRPRPVPLRVASRVDYRSKNRIGSKMGVRWKDLEG